jgi:PAP2 superfamily
MSRMGVVGGPSGRKFEMKTIAGKSPAFRSGSLMTILLLGATCFAQSEGQELQPMGATLASASGPGSEAVQSEESTPALSAWKSQKKADEFTESRLGLSLLKNITLDQKAIWTSPAHLRLDDANGILPFAGIAAASLASDTHISKALTHSTTRVSGSNPFSNYGIVAFAVVPGGLYLLGKMTDDDRKRETGVLSGEAALDAVGATTVLQYAFGRQRPMDGKGGGGFWQGGTSFPSDHATAAWAVASVIAHEYPGPLTKLFVYGLASAVSASRVTGKDHFPTDVIAGAAIGWFVGQHVYRAHHDPELGGSSWGTSAEAYDSASTGNSRPSGSPYVPLDSWIYPAIDRLVALDYIHSAFQDMRPWSRIECATLVQEAGEEIAARESTSGEGDRLYGTLQ